MVVNFKVFKFLLKLRYLVFILFCVSNPLFGNNILEVFKLNDSNRITLKRDNKNYDYRFDSYGKLISIESNNYKVNFNFEEKPYEIFYKNINRHIFKKTEFTSVGNIITQYDDDNDGVFEKKLIREKINEQHFLRQLIIFDKNGRQKAISPKLLYNHQALYQFIPEIFIQSIQEDHLYLCQENLIESPRTMEEILGLIQLGNEAIVNFNGCGGYQQVIQDSVEKGLNCLVDMNASENSPAKLLLEKLRLTSLSLSRGINFSCVPSGGSVAGSTVWDPREPNYPNIKLSSSILDGNLENSEHTIIHELFHTCNEPHNYDSPKHRDIVDVCAACCSSKYSGEKKTQFCGMCSDGSSVDDNNDLIQWHLNSAQNNTFQGFLEANKAYLLEMPSLDSSGLKRMIEIVATDPRVFDDLFKMASNVNLPSGFYESSISLGMSFYKQVNESLNKCVDEQLVSVDLNNMTCNLRYADRKINKDCQECHLTHQAYEFISKNICNILNNRAADTTPTEESLLHCRANKSERYLIQNFAKFPQQYEQLSFDAISPLVDSSCQAQLKSVVENMNTLSLKLNEKLNAENTQNIYINFPQISSGESEEINDQQKLVLEEVDGIYDLLEERSYLNYELENLQRYCQAVN